MMKFKIVKINGYKIKEVDLFLRKLNKWQADGKSKTIATKLQSVKFSLTNKKGYDPKEVDDYLDSLLNPKALNPNTLSNAGIELDYAKDQVLTPAPTITSKRLRELSPPLVEEIGYEKAAHIAKKAYKEKRPIVDVAHEETGLSISKLKTLLNPAKLTKGGI